MSVRVRYRIEVAVSSTTVEERDLGNLKFEVIDDNQGEGGTWKTVLAAGAVNVPIPMDSIATAKFLALKTNPKDPNQLPATVSVRKDLITGEIITLTPLGTNKEAHMVLVTAGVTALFASNPGPAVMELTVCACGD